MKQAIILCAGRGTRLAPLTDKIPKVLIEVNNKTLLEYKLENLQNIVEEVILIVGNKKEKIIEKIGNQYGNLKIKYCEQKEPLGSGHALLQAKDLIKDEFIVLSGDDFYSKKDLENFAKEKFAIIGIEVEKPQTFGILEIDKENNLIKIEEKPQNPKSNLASIGVYAFNTSIFEKILEKSHRGEYEIIDYLNHLIEKGKKIKVLKTNSWMPINNFEELEKAKKIIISQNTF